MMHVQHQPKGRGDSARAHRVRDKLDGGGGTDVHGGIVVLERERERFSVEAVGRVADQSNARVCPRRDTHRPADAPAPPHSHTHARTLS
jgi:hypothetical protein